MKILLVCTGNTCRSSMAEGLLKKMLVEKNKYKDIEIISAGISAMNGESPSEYAIKALEEQKIDISDFKSKQLTADMIEEADLILTMTSSHKNMIISIVPKASEKTFTLKEYAFIDFDLENILEELNMLQISLNKKKDMLEKEVEDKIVELKAKRNKLINQVEELDKELEIFINKSKKGLRPEYQKIRNIERKLQNLDIIDPYGKPLSRYKECAKEISESLEKVIEKIN